MREKSKWIFYILAVAFIGWLVFDVGMGVTGRGQYGGADVVLKVNGEAIHLPLYQAALRSAYEQYRQQNRITQMTREEEQQVENDVVDQLVRNALMQQAYRRLGITATDEEVRDAAQTSPPPEVMQLKDFQTNGQFDIQKWQRFLSSGGNPEFLLQLEERYREQIPQAKLFQYVTADVYVSDSKLWRVFRDQHDSATVTFVAITPAFVSDSEAAVSDAELQRYYDAHQAEFKRPPVAWVSFVALPRAPNAADTAAARARVDRLRAEILAGGPAKFADVAKRESADTVSGAQGGDLSWISRNEVSFDPKFIAGLKGLRVGQVSPPVLSSFGYHLIRVDSARGDSVRVRHLLVPVELAGAHRDSVESRADSLDRLAAERDDGSALDTVARRLGLPLSSGHRIAEGDRLQLGRWVIPNVGVWAFEARPGQTSAVIDADPAYYVFRLDSLQPGGLPRLADVREAVLYQARLERKKAVAVERARQLAGELGSARDLTQAARARGLTVQTVGPFTRLNPPPVFQGAPEALGAAFGLRVGETSPLIKTDNGGMFLQLVGRRLADSTAWLAQRDAERESLLQAARQARVRAYVDGLRASAKVVDRRKELFTPQNATAGS